MQGLHLFKESLPPFSVKVFPILGYAELVERLTRRLSAAGAMAHSPCCLPASRLHGFIEASYAGRESTENFERHHRIFQDNLPEVLWAQGQ